MRIYLNANKQFGWASRCVFCANEGKSKCPAAAVCAQLLDYANANMYLNIYEWVRPKIIFYILWWFTFSLFFGCRCVRRTNAQSYAFRSQRDHAERLPLHTIVVFVRQNTGANKRNSSNAIFSEIPIQTRFYSNIKSTRNTIKASIWVSRRHSHSTLTPTREREKNLIVLCNCNERFNYSINMRLCARVSVWSGADKSCQSNGAQRGQRSSPFFCARLKLSIYATAVQPQFIDELLSGCLSQCIMQCTIY